LRVKRAAFALVFCGAACARTGLLDFGVAESDEATGGRGGSGSAGAAGAPSGGTRVTPDECTNDRDCLTSDFCAPSTCELDTASSSGRHRCLAVPIDCDDGDACTADRCDPLTGACVNEPPSDADGDGFVGTAPPAAPPECGGNDCDDDDPFVHPGAPEVCNGRDDDCNGAIDDGFDVTNVLVSPVPIVPPERDRAAHGGLAYDGVNFGVSYHTTAEHKVSYFKIIGADGIDASAEVESQINADAYSGPIAWSGSSFLTAFADARQDGNYEIYATRYRSDGLRVQHDQRLTDSPDYSLNPVVVWTGDEYVVAWDDRRARTNGGVPQIFARRFSEQGIRIGEETLVSPVGEWAEYPVLAAGEHSLGLAYVSLDSVGVAHARFRSLDFELAGAPYSTDLRLADGANSFAIAHVAGRFVVAASHATEDSVPGDAISMASVDEASGALLEASLVTAGFSFARGPSLVSLGDRAFLVFSGALADGAYELYAGVVVVGQISPMVATELTHSEALSLFPYAAPGADGTIGIVFDEDDETPPTSRVPHFMSVGCRSRSDF
jgi:hypothetical protein